MFGPHLNPSTMYTPVVEDYLKAVWMLQQQESPVSTSRIAERLGLTAAAVTAMVKRLDEQGLLRHEPYYGVRLTAPGELAAGRARARPARQRHPQRQRRDGHRPLPLAG
jgi:Mn-dependent DtxR family transcriptional regulator